MVFSTKYCIFFDANLNGLSIRNRERSDKDIKKWKKMSVEEYLKKEEE